jgi:hypothetical protein
MGWLSSTSEMCEVSLAFARPASIGSRRDPAGERSSGFADKRLWATLIGGSEFVGACRILVKRSTVIALEPQLCRSPIVDLGYPPPKCTVAVDMV